MREEEERKPNQNESAVAGMCGSPVVAGPLCEFIRTKVEPLQQPTKQDDGNCLMTSLLACVGTDAERKILLRFAIDEDVEFRSGNAYGHYR
jgi:hypothetical protein